MKVLYKNGNIESNSIVSRLNNSRVCSDAIMVFLQLAEDYWEDVCHDHAMAGIANYEKWIIREKTQSIVKKVKMTLFSRPNGNVDAIYSSLLDVMADGADTIELNSEEYIENLKNDLSKAVDSEYVGVMCNLIICSIMLYWCNECVRILTGSYNCKISECIDVIDPIPVKYGFKVIGDINMLVGEDLVENFVTPCIEWCSERNALKSVSKVIVPKEQFNVNDYLDSIAKNNNLVKRDCCKI